MLGAKYLLLVLAAALVFATSYTFDLGGVWTLELDPDFGGVRDSVDCTFKQDGEVHGEEALKAPASTSMMAWIS